jgi:hypothetical protein
LILKKIIFVLSQIFICISIFAQYSNRNKVWCIGAAPILKFDYNNSNLLIDTFSNNNKYSLQYGASNICDSNGKLELFCNGFYVLNNLGEIIENNNSIVDSINCPLGTKFRIKANGNGDWNQMSLILPKAKNQYYVFTTGMSDSAFDQWQSPNANFDSFRFDVLTYHVVDMDGNAGLGEVTSKNNILMRDKYLSHNRMTATRHANGRDWWLVKPDRYYKFIYTFLVTADSIYGPYEQAINLPKEETAISGHSSFSMQGDKYAMCEENYDGEFHYWDFDRCSGKFSNYQKITVPIRTDSIPDDWPSAVVFSPNGKYLYGITNYYVYQIDVSQTNKNNYTQVAYYPFAYPKWDASALAPDGKIYIGNENGVINKMSYIANPDEPGLACNFVPMGLEQPFTNLMVPPNMPNYGLGVLAGSGCDTIGKKVKASEWLIYPNPATDNLVIESNWLNGAKDVNIVLFNALGQKVLEKKYSNYTWWRIVLGLQELPRGVYLLKITADANELISKFVAR